MNSKVKIKTHGIHLYFKLWTDFGTVLSLHLFNLDQFVSYNYGEIDCTHPSLSTTKL